MLDVIHGDRLRVLVAKLFNAGIQIGPMITEDFSRNAGFLRGRFQLFMADRAIGLPDRNQRERFHPGVR